MKLGMDIVGPISEAAGGVKIVLIMMGYFTKWVEAAAYAQIREQEVIECMWRNITYWLGIPPEITYDNGP